MRFTHTQNVPSETAFHDTANGHFLLLLLLAVPTSLPGGVEESGEFLPPGLVSEALLQNKKLVPTT